MIFKTFNSNIDKWTAKIGIFGKSFNKLGTAVNNVFKATIDNIDNFDENIGFWESLKNNLFSKNDSDKDWIKNSLGEIISQDTIDSFIAKLEPDKAREKLKDIFDWKNIIDDNSNDKTWQDYFDTLKDGSEKYISDLIKNTDDLSKLEGQDLVNACNEAREVTLAHNAALKQQTLGAKAAKVGMQALTMVGNIGISLLITGDIKLVDALITTEEELEEQRQAIISAGETARQTIDQIESDFESHTSTVKDVKDRYIELSQGVNNLGKANQNQGSLSSDEYAEFLDISNQLTDAFPTLKTGVLSTGDALTSLNGDAQTITSTLQDLLDTKRALAAKKITDTFGARWEEYRVNSTDAITEYNEYGQKLEDLDTILYRENNFIRLLYKITFCV